MFRVSTRAFPICTDFLILRFLDCIYDGIKKLRLIIGALFSVVIVATLTVKTRWDSEDQNWRIWLTFRKLWTLRCCGVSWNLTGWIVQINFLKTIFHTANLMKQRVSWFSRYPIGLQFEMTTVPCLMWSSINNLTMESFRGCVRDCAEPSRWLIRFPRRLTSFRPKACPYKTL